MKIYVITKGDYSDYHICAVATEKQKAELLQKLYSENCYGGEAEIEEYDTSNNGIMDNLTETTECYCISFDAKYKIEDIEVVNYEYISTWANETEGRKLNEIMADGWFPYAGNAKYIIFILADSEEKAKKIACDAMAKYRAEKLGL